MFNTKGVPPWTQAINLSALKLSVSTIMNISLSREAFWKERKQARKKNKPQKQTCTHVHLQIPMHVYAY